MAIFNNLESITPAGAPYDEERTPNNVPLDVFVKRGSAQEIYQFLDRAQGENVDHDGVINATGLHDQALVQAMFDLMPKTKAIGIASMLFRSEPKADRKKKPGKTYGKNKKKRKR